MKESGKHDPKRLFTVLCILDAVWTAVIFSWSMAPASLSSEESSWVLLIIQKVFPSATEHLVRKTAHFTEFMILGALLSASAGVYLMHRNTVRSKAEPQALDSAASDRKAGQLSQTLRNTWLQPAVSIGIGLIVAVCDELIQLTSPGRSCQLSDMLLDLCGVIVGAVIVLLFFRKKHRGR